MRTVQHRDQISVKGDSTLLLLRCGDMKFCLMDKDTYFTFVIISRMKMTPFHPAPANNTYRRTHAYFTPHRIAL